MDIKEITKIVELMAKHDLTEIDIQAENNTLTIKRERPGSDGQAPTLVTQMAPMVAPLTNQAPVAAGNAVTAPPAENEDEGRHTIVSPIVGTFYDAPSPDADLFVNVGDEVVADTVVCIVEAMKVMNEITANVSGIVKKVLVENGHPVEFGEPLFVIEA
ncbi:MAG TPA: acetyl-CoA carboxylase biotin carboxyl carrier protein [Lentisphaeria bacterium]|nr:acetyl-CoA carboxylase biotin carboxyl carrier protein [Lentisphaeria bacterium]